MTESKLGDLQIQYVSVDEVDPHPDNANVGNVEVIKESIKINGYYAPVIVQASTGYILAGNHRYLAAKSLGYASVPVIYVDVDDEEAKRIMVADNRTTRIGHDDDESLMRLLEDIGSSELGLLGTGFTHADLQTLQDAVDKFDSHLVPEPDPEPTGGEIVDWLIEPLEDGQGGCGSVLIHRHDRRSLTPEDYNRLRVALGLGRAARGALATLGIEDWA